MYLMFHADSIRGASNLESFNPVWPKMTHKPGFQPEIRTALVEVGGETFVKYMTCGKDGTFRVWSSQTNR